ncbi:ABC transporter ATP-binding protein [Lacrimispora brassicae]
MEHIISCKNVVKTYGKGSDSQHVLDGIDMEIAKGEFVSIMGPSGSGKSTLLFAVSGMDTIDGGTTSFAGRDLGSYTENQLADLRRTQMGFVFQQPTMLRNLNILDNIILPSIRDNRKNARMITEKARRLMKTAGILELADREITQVSGGQLQRAGICRGLMADPQIIFCDEPTGALNSKSAEEIMDIFTEINAEGTALMLVTHDAKVAARTERILFMSDGKIDGEMQLGKFKDRDIDGRMKKIVEKMRRIGI